MTRTEEFEELRPLLFAIADRILVSASEAEDAVQATWLRWADTPTRPASIEGHLAAEVTRISTNVLRSARLRRQAHVGPWPAEALLGGPHQDPEQSAELADSRQGDEVPAAEEAENATKYHLTATSKNLWRWRVCPQRACHRRLPRRGRPRRLQAVGQPEGKG